MSIISFRPKGDFAKVDKYFGKLKNVFKIDIFNRYGQKGVSALKSATPINSGKTASSWFYKVKKNSESVAIEFYNSNENKGVPIAIILQYGHGTRNGGYVQGRDYINPAIQPIFEQLASELWREVIAS